MSTNSNKVLIAMSGGVDSTVAAFLLKSQGMDVYGITFQFLRAQDKKDLSEDFESSCHIEDLNQVKKICDSLGIGYYAVNAKAEFESKILDKVISSRIIGNFFSSCFWCNQIKFKILSEKAELLKIDNIATGHYAKIHFNKDRSKAQFYRSNDKDHDQSALLGSVPEEYLKKLILPLSELRKKEVLEIAKRYNLEFHTKPERKESCFFYSSSINNYIAKRAHGSLLHPASFFDSKQELHVGESQGLYAHYLGETNLKIDSTAAPVDKKSVITKLDHRSYEIVLGHKKELMRKSCKISHLLFPKGYDRTKPQNVYFSFENGDPIKGILYFKNNDSAIAEFEEDVFNMGAAHAVSIYNSNSKTAKLLGSGVVELFENFKMLKRVSDTPEDLPDDYLDEDENEIKPSDNTEDFSF